MLNQHTLNQLKTLKLDGMAIAFSEQFAQRATDDLSFEGKREINPTLHLKKTKKRMIPF